MEGQDNIKLSIVQNSTKEHDKETDSSRSAQIEKQSDEANANNTDILNNNDESPVPKENKTQIMRKKPLAHSEDAKDANGNMTCTGDVKPTNAGPKNICIGSIREKIKKQLELKKSAKQNKTEEKLAKESITNEEAIKMKRIEEDKTTTDIKDGQAEDNQDIIDIERAEDKSLLKISPEKIDKASRPESNQRLMTDKEVSSFLMSLPPKKVVTAEELAAISRAASADKWIVYNPEDGDLSEWLEKNKPSEVRRSEGVGWIAVISDDSIQEKKKECQKELKEAWEAVVANTDQINTSKVKKLAKQFGVTGGKWIFHVTTDRVDVVWGRVAKAWKDGKLGPNISQVKVSPRFDTSEGEVTGYGAHVISVYNTDFTSEEQVLQVETSLRQAMIRCMFQYKPQIYSILGIYRNNRWGLRPTIYHSQYHLKRGKSIIEFAFENTWFRNETKGFGDENEEIKKREKVSDKTVSNIEVGEAIQSKETPLTFEGKDHIEKKGGSDPNKTEVVLKVNTASPNTDNVDGVKNDEGVSSETANVIKDYLKDEYETSKDKCTTKEDPGLKLMKGLGIDLDEPKEVQLMDDQSVRDEELRSKVEMECLRSRVLSWLLTGEGHPDEASHQSQVTLNTPNNGSMITAIADTKAMAMGVSKEDSLEETDDSDEYDNHPMEKMCAIKITSDKDMIGESDDKASPQKINNENKIVESGHSASSLKVANVSDKDTHDETTPLKDEKKEKVDLKKPSWLKNLQNKVSKNN